MSVRRAVRAWDEEFGADDAPLWAEVFGSVLVFGLFVRSGAHVWAAIIGGVDPSLAEGHDVTAANVVDEARLDTGADLAGRLLAVAFGVGAWILVDPLAMTWPGPAWTTILGRAWLSVNLGVLFADPLLFAIERLRTTTNTKS